MLHRPHTHTHTHTYTHACYIIQGTQFSPRQALLCTDVSVLVWVYSGPCPRHIQQQIGTGIMQGTHAPDMMWQVRSSRNSSGIVMPARPSASVMPLLTASVRAAARVSGVSTTDMLCKASQLSRSACRMISCARVACAFVGVCACVWVRASYISLLAHLRF